MAPNGWFNLEAGNSNIVPSAIPYFSEDSAFKSFGLSKETRLYGFISWYGPTQFLLNCTFTKLATHSVVLGFVLSILGTGVLFIGQMVMFAGMFLAHTSTSSMVTTIHHSVIRFGDRRYSRLNRVPYRSMFSLPSSVHMT